MRATSSSWFANPKCLALPPPPQAPECFVGSWSFEQKFYMYQAAPLVVAGLFMAVQALGWVWVRCIRMSESG